MKCVNHANEKHKKDYLGNYSRGSVIEDGTLTLAIDDDEKAKEKQENSEDDAVDQCHLILLSTCTCNQRWTNCGPCRAYRCRSG